ncbi:MAG: hypothetical protein LKJ13_04395 [Clostridia bacterium]|jgi:hypothetical protein|nr:hypothetical protein [Clostridia bacterium]MCI1998944.1 hypothetical protein [Clostridia bacterium]MCI2013694.1 hypothetical protein [Clostridia bacterium]
MKKAKKLKPKYFRKTRRLYKLGKFIIFILNSASFIMGAVSIIKKVLSLMGDRKQK